MFLQVVNCASLIGAHKTAVARNIGGSNRGQSAEIFGVSAVSDIHEQFRTRVISAG